MTDSRVNGFLSYSDQVHLTLSSTKGIGKLQAVMNIQTHLVRWTDCHTVTFPPIYLCKITIYTFVSKLFLFLFVFAGLHVTG